MRVVHECLEFRRVLLLSDGVAFQVELAYAGLFGMRNMPADQVQPFLLAEAPRLLFPFARRILADAVRDGGFPPLLLEPIDFGALYMQQAEAAQAQQGGQGAVGHACRSEEHTSELQSLMRLS